MQISDLVNQYNNNLATGGEISTRAKGVEQLVSTVQKLTAGQVFEGTVNAIRGNNVILGLSSGQNITATLAKDILLEQGQSVFFQVKSNDGQTIQIKPVSNNALNNPTLLNALDSANLAVNERNVNMVNNMMREQMPIDTASLNNMAKLVSSNPDINVSTIIQMNKLGIDVNPNMAAQYENYQTNQASVMDMISNLTESIPSLISSYDMSYEQATTLNKEIVNILTNDLAEALTNSSQQVEAIASQATNANGELLYVNSDGESTVNNIVNVNNEPNLIAETGVNENATATIDKGIDSFIQQVNNADNEVPVVNVNTAIDNSAEAAIVSDNIEVVYNQDSYPRNSIGNTLTEEQYKALNDLIKNDTSFLDNNTKLLDANGNLDPKANVAEFMKAFAEYSGNVDVSKQVIKNLFSSDSYKALVDNLTEQQWTLDPQELGKDPVKRLYEKLEQSMKQLQDVTANMGKIGGQVNKATTEIRSNIDFMNQVNQTFTYVQLPIRMSNQNANTDLYVYRNKTNKSEDDEISAFLHFDMDHLGSTDISVKLLNNNVDTKFYMEDDRSYQLIMDNVEILQKKLEGKGFNCNISVENEGKEVNLVEDFLKSGSKSSAPVSRYSFDVRA